MKTILIVDDEPDVLKVLSARLEQSGFNVLTATDGEEGVKTAVNQRPDLIIMDVLMPRLSGGEAVKKIRANNATVDTPVIFLSAVAVGRTTDAWPENKINVGGVFYTALPKPLNSEKLLAEIRQLIG